MTITPMLNLLYKVNAAMNVAIVTYFLKTGNATEFNPLELLFTICSFFIKRIAIVVNSISYAFQY
jgi:hypothetical protein